MVMKQGRYKRSSSPYFLEPKQWNPIFLERRKYEDRDKSFLESLKEIGAGKYWLDAFLGNRHSSWEAELVDKFCRHEIGSGDPHKQARAWVDDIEIRTGKRRPYPKWLSPGQLRQILEPKRFGSPNLPDADRRLIYISSLTPDYIKVLAETASYREIYPLRAAVGKHIASSTSLRVHLPPAGFISFQLELHLPYLALREIKNPSEYFGAESESTTGMGWFDVSFLNIESARNNQPGCFVIEESKISVVIWGTDHFKWIGYAFAKVSKHDPFQGDDEDDNEDDEDEDDDEDDDGYREDPIASVGVDDVVLDAGMPVLDPRLYWLRVTAIRVGIVVKEWVYLVQKIEASVKACTAKDSLKLESISFNKRNKYLTQRYEWTTQTMELLSKLREYSLATMEAWERFNSIQGGRGYFSDMRDRDAQLSLHSIHESFDELMALEYKLDSLDKLCEESAKKLSLRMNLESNRLNLESNRLNYEAVALTQDNNRLSLKTSEHALESHKTADMMNRTAYLSFEILLITTPIAIALQYFSSEREIFSFERNPKSFLLCIIVVSIVLRIFTFLIHRVQWIKGEILLKLWICIGQLCAPKPAGDIIELERLEDTGQQV